MTILIGLCVLLLLAYVFDLSAARTRIPSVILLLLLGWAVRGLVRLAHLQPPDFTPLLPVLGTVGLILIVLEGALELEFNAAKLPVIGRSFVLALLPLLAAAGLIAAFLHFFGRVSWHDAVINSAPLCVISSAIAIPSARGLAAAVREVVVYESSLSDILGVLLFNFVALNDGVTAAAFAHFGLQLVVIVAVSFGAVLGLSFLLGRIEHHVTFAPIILLVILIYAVSKVLHLPGLVFILVFGLFLGNLDELKHARWMDFFRPEKLDREVAKFREITGEAAFLVRVSFFLLFGFLLETRELFNGRTILPAAALVAVIIAVRWTALRLLSFPVAPLLTMAPRGLITVLLFLSISPAQAVPWVNRSLVIQVIVLSALVMMGGLLKNSPRTGKKTE